MAAATSESDETARRASFKVFKRWVKKQRKGKQFGTDEISVKKRRKPFAVVISDLGTRNYNSGNSDPQIAPITQILSGTLCPRWLFSVDSDITLELSFSKFWQLIELIVSAQLSAFQHVSHSFSLEE